MLECGEGALWTVSNGSCFRSVRLSPSDLDTVWSVSSLWLANGKSGMAFSIH